MNFKIKFYCIFLFAIYLFAIMFSFYNGFEEHKASFMDGLNSDKSSYATFYVNLTPKAGYHTFPMRDLNIKNGKEVYIETSSSIVKVEKADIHSSTPIFLFKLLVLVFMPFCLFGVAALPFLFFSVVRTVSSVGIIDLTVIGRIRQISIVVIGYFLLSFLLNLSEYLSANEVLELANNKIVFQINDYFSLILGVVGLLLAEVLKVSLAYKQEQDLTI